MQMLRMVDFKYISLLQSTF